MGEVFVEDLIAEANFADNSQAPQESVVGKFVGEGKRVLIDLAFDHFVELERLYQGFLDALKNGSSDVVLTVRKFDIKFPVCLSGIGGIGYRWGSAERHAICLLAVIPEASETTTHRETGIVWLSATCFGEDRGG